MMRPLPLLAAAALLAFLALRRRTLGRITAAAGAARCHRGGRLRPRAVHASEPRRRAHAPRTALGNWTYPLVGVLAYLEAAAFVGLLVPGELTVVLGGAVARDGDDLDLAALRGRVVRGGRRRHDRIRARPQARARLPLPAGPRFHITPAGRRARRGHLRQARRQGDHPRPLHRRRPSGHAVPRRQLTPRVPAVPGLRHRPAPVPGRRHSWPSAI